MTVVDPIAVEGVPVIMTDAYVEIGTAEPLMPRPGSLHRTRE